MNLFSLKVIASNKVFFEGHAQRIIIPAVEGQQAVLAHHENMIIAICGGGVRIVQEDESVVEAVVGLGFAQVVNNRVTVLVDTAERPGEIDILRAREAKERAEEQLRQQQSIREYHHTQASLARAMARLKAVSKLKH